MPESVRDRPTKAHEYIFLLSKKERYYYDAESIAEPFADERMGNPGTYTPHYQIGSARNDGNQIGANGQWDGADRAGRNKRSVWTVTTKPYSGAHFATFPPDLIEPCIKAGCPEQCCSVCDAPWERVTRSESTGSYEAKVTSSRDGVLRNDLAKHGGRIGECRTETIGWQPSCQCNAPFWAGTVLDPFGGAGTTGLVADRLQRNAVLIELNADYADMARKRITGDSPLFADVA
jgi:hypothetical protein